MSFAVAMFLIDHKLNDNDLPETLPDRVIPPNKRQTLVQVSSSAFNTAKPTGLQPGSLERWVTERFQVRQTNFIINPLLTTNFSLQGTSESKIKKRLQRFHAGSRCTTAQ